MVKKLDLENRRLNLQHHLSIEFSDESISAPYLMTEDSAPQATPSTPPATWLTPLPEIVGLMHQQGPVGFSGLFFRYAYLNTSWYYC